MIEVLSSICGDLGFGIPAQDRNFLIHVNQNYFNKLIACFFEDFKYYSIGDSKWSNYTEEDLEKIRQTKVLKIFVPGLGSLNIEKVEKDVFCIGLLSNE